MRKSSTRAVAFFYCDCKDERSQNTVNLLATLVAQISLHNENCFLALKDYYDELHSKDQMPRQPRVKGLMKLLQSMSSGFQDVRIIVDGLDECGDNTTDVGKALMEVMSTSNSKISLALLSRDISEIRDIFGAPVCEHIEIAAQTEDVALYVREEIEKRQRNGRFRVKSNDLRDLIVQRLVSKAQGM